MADKKKGKERPDKYAEKVKLNTSLEETLKIFADVANNKAKAKQAELKK